jgi:ATP-dependent DNA ligase
MEIMTEMKIKAMLAHKYNEDKAYYPAFIQPKLDGVRCLFSTKGAFSRTGNQFMNVMHIEKALEPFFAKYPNAVVDGELYNHGLKDDFEKIISLVRKKKPTVQDVVEASQLTQYHVYDIASMEYATYIDRNLFILAEPCFKNKYCIQITPTRLATDFDHAQQWHEKNLKAGYEGSIYRTPSGKYKGTRSWDLMKFKDFHDAEATIIGYEIGKGKREGTLGKFIMQDYEGNKFGCPPGKGYNYKDLANMLENIHDYIGQYATFTYFERTKAGSYRHPHYKAIRNYE